MITEFHSNHMDCNDAKNMHTYFLHNPFSDTTSMSLSELTDVIINVSIIFMVRKVLLRLTPRDVVAILTNNRNYPVILVRPGKGVWLHYRKEMRRRRPVHTPTAKHRGRRRMRRGRPAPKRARRRQNHRRRTPFRPTAAIGVRLAVGVCPSPLRSPFGGLFSSPFTADGSRWRQKNRRRIVRRLYADGLAFGVCFLIFKNFGINIGCI